MNVVTWRAVDVPCESIPLGGAEFATYLPASRDSVLLNEIDKTILDLLRVEGEAMNESQLNRFVAQRLELPADESLQQYVNQSLQQLQTVGLADRADSFHASLP